MRLLFWLPSFAEHIKLLVSKQRVVRWLCIFAFQFCLSYVIKIKINLLFLILISALTGDVIISPQNPVARVNEGFALTCRAADAEKNLIESCSWLRNNQSLPFLNAGYSDFGYITTNECVIYVRNITQEDTGLWTCNIWGPIGKESASTVLTVIGNIVSRARRVEHITI